MILHRKTRIFQLKNKEKDVFYVMKISMNQIMKIMFHLVQLMTNLSMID
jgi:hypothetical protein